jgi:hypothetical protein
MDKEQIMIIRRNRAIYLGIIIVVMILGLLSRKFSLCFPNILRKNIGDALWATLIFFLFRFIFNKLIIQKVALIAIAFSFLIEFSQLYHNVWIDKIRSTLFGKLVLGSGFAWSDLICYIVGVGLGITIEIIIISKGKKT